MFDITANADITRSTASAASVLKIDYEFANGTTLRSVSGYQKGQHGIPRGPRRHQRRQQHLRRHRRTRTIYSQEINLISSDAGQVQVDPRRVLPARRRRVSAGRRFYIGIPTGPLSARAARTPQETLGAVRPGQLRSAGGLRAAARRALLGTQHRQRHRHQPVRACRSRRTRRRSSSNLSGKVALNWTVNRHHFLYAFVATGFRPGGLNVPVGLGDRRRRSRKKRSPTTRSAGRRAGRMAGCARSSMPTTTTTRTSR